MKIKLLKKLFRSLDSHEIKSDQEVESFNAQLCKAMSKSDNRASNELEEQEIEENFEKEEQQTENAKSYSFNSTNFKQRKSQSKNLPSISPYAVTKCKNKRSLSPFSVDFSSCFSSFFSLLFIIDLTVRF